MHKTPLENGLGQEKKKICYYVVKERKKEYCYPLVFLIYVKMLADLTHHVNQIKWSSITALEWGVVRAVWKKKK